MGGRQNVPGRLLRALDHQGLRSPSLVSCRNLLRLLHGHAMLGGARWELEEAPPQFGPRAISTARAMTRPPGLACATRASFPRLVLLDFRGPEGWSGGGSNP